MMMLLLALVVPFTMGNSDPARVLPDQPVPNIQTGTETPDTTESAASATLVASSTQSGQQIRGAAPPTQPEPYR
jgi:hypothetical protein